MKFLMLVDYDAKINSIEGEYLTLSDYYEFTSYILFER